ncbi:pyruvate kinase [Nitrosomonas aestuarii]|uniref:pyruvate kinase n=2 Tax=Nitrosomonas aestuarii TaxID=52441 RepID=A0A1I4AZV6_9PROT|nr:pyruvate kinase [Nitrosomonas aestuarii]
MFHHYNFRMNSENQATSHAHLHHLHTEILRLIHHVREQGAVRLDRCTGIDKTKPLNKSIVNLTQYLALREKDLRPLQEKLAEAGLSSLGRAEPHVYANLKNVLNILSQVLEISVNIKTSLCYPAFKEGFDILSSNTHKVLGDSQHKRTTRVMVTLSVEATEDSKIIRDLIREGMDIARINCAHDDILIWQKMIENIRKAIADEKSPCRILMDLAGHKIRTGRLLNDPQSLNIKLKKNTARFKIVPDEQGKSAFVNQSKNEFIFPVPKAVYSNLREGDRLSMKDARGRQRYITVSIIPENEQVTGCCDKTIHLISGLAVTWQQYTHTGFNDRHTFRFVNFNLTTDAIRLQAGDRLFLHKQQTPGFFVKNPTGDKLTTAVHISCSVPGVIDALDLGARVWINDGKISAYVNEKTAEYVVLHITKTGAKGAKLKSDMGINFPGTKLDLPALTAKDKTDLDFICQNADMIGFSFIETADDMHELIAELQHRNASSKPIILKIETARAVQNLPDILLNSLLTHPIGVMIARGDLAVELGNVRMAEMQEEILWLCEAAHVPVIWATQVLESVAKYGIRSRPEFTDAAMSVRAECVMLNKGPYILDAVRSLNAVLKCMQQHQHKKISRLRALHW